MNANRPSPGMELFVELSRKEPFRTVMLFFLGFLPTATSRTVLTAFILVELLTKLPFVHLGIVATTALSFAFSLYCVAGFIVWYKHEGFDA